jgi:hypothetical protein
MRQDGFTPVILLLIVAAIAIVGSTVAYSIVLNKHSASSSTQTENAQESSSLNTEDELLPTNTQIPTSKNTTIPKTPTSQPILTPTSIVKHNTCSVNLLADTSSQNNVRLTAGATSNNGSYIKGAQWDFEGNGSWDTDMNISNQNTTHNYSNGTYTVRLRTLMSDGSTTEVCTKSVSVPFGFTVSLDGVVYEDRNCNDMREPDEKGLAGVTVGITNMDGYGTLATLTTDSNGYYKFSYTLSAGNAITVSPYDKPLDNYGVTKTRHKITLNSAQNSISMNLGQIPAPVGDYCGF